MDHFFLSIAVSNARSPLSDPSDRVCHHAVKLNYLDLTQFIFKNEFVSHPITQSQEMPFLKTYST